VAAAARGHSGHSRRPNAQTDGRQQAQSALAPGERHLSALVCQPRPKPQLRLQLQLQLQTAPPQSRRANGRLRTRDSPRDLAKLIICIHSLPSIGHVHLPTAAGGQISQLAATLGAQNSAGQVDELSLAAGGRGCARPPLGRPAARTQSGQLSPAPPSPLLSAGVNHARRVRSHLSLCLRRSAPIQLAPLGLLGAACLSQVGQRRPLIGAPTSGRKARVAASGRQAGLGCIGLN